MTMTPLSVFGLLLALAYASANPSFTLLEIDNHPCKAENLRKTDRYICDHKGKVICQPGWRDSDEQIVDVDLYPCLEPICDDDGKDCVNGECRAPGQCACEIGWEGEKCDECIPLPGCKHGSCKQAFECNCAPGWEGAQCDKPKCSNCSNGECVGPEKCRCHDGWNGNNCDVCEPRKGCLHGTCDQPHTCNCKPNWGGILCDQPVCSKPCEHGVCVKGHEGSDNFCMCDAGWKGESCNQCVPYWRCPNNDTDACHLPNQCFCTKNEDDPEKLCNHKALNEHKQHNDEYLGRAHSRFISTTEAPITTPDSSSTNSPSTTGLAR